MARDWELAEINRAIRLHNICKAGKYNEHGNIIKEKKYHRRVILTDNLGSHTFIDALWELKFKNIDNYSLIKKQTDKIQPSDRHAIIFGLCNVISKNVFVD